MYGNLTKVKQASVDDIISDASGMPIEEINPKELKNLRERYASLPEEDFLDLITGNNKLKNNGSFVDRQRDKGKSVQTR